MDSPEALDLYEISLSGLSQLVVLISQIKVNSMAVVHMKSLDACEQGKHSVELSHMDNTLTNQIEQVRVGQAIYSTEFVEAGYPLEISYGPQVGQGDLKDQQKVLEDHCFGTVVDRSMINGKRQGTNWIQDVSTISCLEQPLPVDKQKRDDAREVAQLLFEHKDDGLETDLGYCLNCRSYRDLESSQETIRQAVINIKRVG
ncbi:hypothetical protein MKX01_012320 [Papaver californicum]|nr:hypothetical protein MKX01_012320 [Papaver californicum]